ncbi:universal stress protein [Desulfonatronovibrio magnus]|uniref:universal stress protein n=1 Tax=Desulfonatronovibrio magnus TaxID=698827 RepID=UPI0005EAC99D|nr:universal stress protein [Desulfonatronovibrio magnus]
MTEIKTILCAIDFSEISSKIASYAQEIAVALNAKVHVLYVAPTIDQYSYFRIPPTDFQTYVNEAFVDAEIRMESFIKDNFDFLDVTGNVLAGYSSEIILDFARIENIDLIVMGTHGRTGFSRMLLGSVAERVVKSAQVPVITIRPE